MAWRNSLKKFFLCLPSVVLWSAKLTQVRGLTASNVHFIFNQTFISVAIWPPRRAWKASSTFWSVKVIEHSLDVCHESNNFQSKSCQSLSNLEVAQVFIQWSSFVAATAIKQCCHAWLFLGDVRRRVVGTMVFTIFSFHAWLGYLPAHPLVIMSFLNVTHLLCTVHLQASSFSKELSTQLVC